MGDGKYSFVRLWLASFSVLFDAVCPYLAAAATSSRLNITYRTTLVAISVWRASASNIKFRCMTINMPANYGQSSHTGHVDAPMSGL